MNNETGAAAVSNQLRIQNTSGGGEAVALGGWSPVSGMGWVWQVAAALPLLHRDRNS